MKLHKDVTEQDYANYKSSYVGYGGEQILTLAEILADVWDAVEPLDDALVIAFNRDKALNKMPGSHIIEAIFVLSQLWVDREKITDVDQTALTITEWRLLAESTSLKLNTLETMAGEAE